MHRDAAARGRLKHGNPPGDPSTAPRCGAKTRRHTACLAPAMRNGRCRMHGGCSTGPQTPEGLERSRRARLTHGEYAQATVARRRAWRDLVARQVAQERADKLSEAANRRALARFFGR